MNKSKRYGVENFININGKRVDVYSAKIVYRCEVCHAPLNYRGAGLVCSNNPDHRGFIHRNKADRIQAQQVINVKQLSDFYQIVDGKVVIRNGN